VPLVIVILALWFLMESGGTNPRQRWIHFVAAIGVAGLPLFYHLETTDAYLSPTWWGLMDTFEASLAVLAVVLLLVSARRLSLGLFIAGTIVASFTLLVKPAGIVIIPLIFWHWAAEVLIVHAPFRTAWRTKGTLRIYTIAAVLFALLTCSAVLFLCVNSAFLRHDAFLYFRNATAMLSERVSLERVRRILRDLHYTVGWHWAIVLGILFAVRTASLFKGLRLRSVSREDIRFFAAFAALCGGIWWWFTMAGTLYRYIEPFLLVFLAVVLPDVAKAAARWKPRVRWALGITCCVPFLLILPMVIAPHPPQPLQRLAG
jgi:hypothetical protein